MFCLFGFLVVFALLANSLLMLLFVLLVYFGGFG